MNTNTIRKLAWQIIKTEMPSKFIYMVKYMEINLELEEEGPKITFELPYYELIRRKNNFTMELGFLCWAVLITSRLYKKETIKKALKVLLEDIVKKIEEESRKYRFVEICNRLIKYRRSKIKDMFIEELKKLAEKDPTALRVKHFIFPKDWIKVVV